jgi:shikimate kinase
VFEEIRLMAFPLLLSDRNLILTGYTGSNQPRLGRQIAERLRMPLVNLEAQIAERYGMSVDDIRTAYGETRLKSIEAGLIDEACLRRNTLIAVNARTLLNGDALLRLSEIGHVICLVTTLDAMLHRLHLAMGARFYNPDERAIELGNLKREWAVRGLAGVIEVDTTGLDAEATIDHVVRLWQSLAIKRG